MISSGWVRLVVGAAAAVLSACSDSDEQRGERVEAGGGAGAAASSGGAAPGGGAGVGPGGAANAGGAVAAGGKPANGAGGGGTVPDGTVGRDPNAHFDKTLGGFNQELPEPSQPCEVADYSLSACMSVSGTYNGTPFDFRTYPQVAYVYLDGGSRNASGSYLLSPGDEIQIGTKMALALAPTAPSVFELPAAPADPSQSFVSVTRAARQLESHPGDIPIADTHDVQVRMAGEFWFARSREGGPRHEQVLAYFALSLTPKPGCVKDQDGFGCDAVRLRGMLTGSTLRDLPP